MTRGVIVLALAAGAVASGAPAQTIADRVAAAPDGAVRMSYAARPGVCGHGDNIMTYRRRDRDWESDCETGPVRVTLTKVAGEVTRIRTRVGGRWRDSASGIDLGTVVASDAAAYLLGLARRGGSRASRDAILPATLADGAVTWPVLLDVARDETRPDRTRKRAVQAVATQAAEVLDSVPETVDPEDPDRKAREQAIFALSQLSREDAVPRLLDVAENHRLGYARRRALFWLGQTGDARAIALLERVMREGQTR